MIHSSGCAPHPSGTALRTMRRSGSVEITPGGAHPASTAVIGWRDGARSAPVSHAPPVTPPAPRTRPTLMERLYPRLRSETHRTSGCFRRLSFAPVRRLTDMRGFYAAETLEAGDLAATWLAQFERWL